jgi:hypothetical protein
MLRRMATSTDLPHGWKRALRDYVRDVELALIRAARPDDPRLADAVELLRANLRVPRLELGGAAPAVLTPRMGEPVQRSPHRLPWKRYDLPAPRLEPPKAPRGRPRAKPPQPRDEDDELDDE